MRQARLRLEPFEARDVPAAVVDLSTAGASGIANGALFRQTDVQPTGSGVIHSFLRLQATGTEQGFNTDARPLQFDELKSATFTRSLPLNAVPVVNVGGVAYRKFLLDINQTGTSPLLSLDELRLYVGGSRTLTGYNTTLKTLGALTPVFDMDGSGDATVKMNASLGSGSGSGDVFVLIPNSAFNGTSGYVYLYSKFGGTWGGNSGFEEWAVQAVAQPTQCTGSISGTVVLDSNGDHMIDPADGAFAGIVVNLLDSNNVVIATTKSAAEGTYSFGNLAAGTYSVQIVVPSVDYATMFPNVGTDSGMVQPSWTAITDIHLNAGDNASGYNFGLWDSSL